MKKIIAILLALTLMLAGCSQNTAPSGTVETNPAATEAPVSGTVETAPPAEETEAPTEAPAEEKEISLGRMEGGIYTNAYAGFGCELDANWTFYTAEELQQLPTDVAELFEDTDMDLGYDQISDMMAENVNDMTTMNVLYTRVSMAERVAYAAMTDEEIVDATLEQKDAIITAYEQAGIQVDSIEKITVNFLGEERAAIHTVCAIEGYPYYILQISDYHLGQYGVTLTFSSYFEDNTTSMLDLFYAVE